MWHHLAEVTQVALTDRAKAPTTLEFAVGTPTRPAAVPYLAASRYAATHRFMHAPKPALDAAAGAPG